MVKNCPSPLTPSRNSGEYQRRTCGIRDWSACFLFQTDVIPQDLIDPALEAMALPLEKSDNVPIKFEGDGLFVRSRISACPECIIKGGMIGIGSGHSLDLIFGEAIDAITIRF
jgi:hypothetical protein